ncbi:hypothetical protein PTKIN_Ptkin01aG0327300 [Pterospermum kingtungense]
MDSPPLSKCGLGLITNIETPPRVNPNVISSTSSALINVNPMAPTSLSPSSTKKDPGGIGLDDMGGGVDGLMSCTESLGFESCDERRVDDDDNNKKFCGGEMGRWRRKRREEKRGRDARKFPPPISSLNQNGQPCLYLKPVRKNGRLELIEVRLQRHEILRAVREDGRLRLHLVSSDVLSEINEEEVNDEMEDTKREEQEQLEFHLQEEEEEVMIEEEEEEEEEGNRVEELWKYRVGGEGWRCNEQVMSHHNHHHHRINDHHSLHVWRQPCVTR